jgi:hypothetical protein
VRQPNIPLFSYKDARQEYLLQLQLHGVGQHTVAGQGKRTHPLKSIVKLLLLLLLLLLLMLLLLLLSVCVCTGQHMHEHAVRIPINHPQLLLHITCCSR